MMYVERADFMSQKTYWNRHAARYDASMRILGKPMPRMLELTRAAISNTDRVLEVAAGTGLVTRAIADKAREVVATDYAEGMVAQLEQRVRDAGLTNVQCRQADIYELPFEAGSFDVVVAANVLHLVPDLDRALASLRNALRPGGKLIAPTFLHEETLLARIASRAFALTGFPGHRRFSMRSLREAVERAGMRVTRVELIPGVFPIGYVEAVL